MKVYSYYQSIPSTNQDEHFACANLWKASWSHYGWEPVMLNRSHAQVSSKYNKMLQKLVSELRHIDSLRPQFDFIVARFIRWCALHASGGGWMSDYDVLNTGFTPEFAKSHEAAVVTNEGPAHIFYVSEQAAQSVIHKFLGEDIINNSNVITEHNILNIHPSTFNGLTHIKSEEGNPKSSVMRQIWENNLSQVVS